jgi:hypothetical protein
MKITRTSYYSGITRTLDIPCTEAEMAEYEAGALIQNAFPNLKDEEREFIKTGITGEEWTEMFAYPDTDGDY